MCNCHSNFSEFKIYLLFHLSFSLEISYPYNERRFEIWEISSSAFWKGMIGETIEYKVNHVVFYEYKSDQPNENFDSYLVSLKHAFCLFILLIIY